MTRVGLKLCGGCDESFDRAAYWEAIQAAAAGRVEWTPLDAGGYAVALYLSACPSACVENEHPPAPGTRAVFLRDNRRPPAEVVAELLSGSPA